MIVLAVVAVVAAIVGILMGASADALLRGATRGLAASLRSDSPVHWAARPPATSPALPTCSFSH